MAADAISEVELLDEAEEWHSSSEYAEALRISRKAPERRVIFADGVPAPAGS